MSTSFCLGDDSYEIVISPVWEDIFGRVRDGVCGANLDLVAQDFETAPSVLLEGRSNLMAALEHPADSDGDLALKLSENAVELLTAVVAVWSFHRPGSDRREALTQKLRRRLSANERGVLKGELTYTVSVEEAKKLTARVDKTADLFLSDQELLHTDLISLQEAALATAALQVRVAGNIRTGGQAGEAAAAKSSQVDGLLQDICEEVAVTARDGLRRAPPDHDPVALHLGSGLRLLASPRTLGGFASEPLDAAEQSAFLRGARAAWLELARLEHVVTSALDRELQPPTYEERFGGLSAAIIEGAANVLYGARLVSRPGAFRHSDAWASQSVALSYAMEAYIRGLRGNSEGFAQAQLVVLTRLVRAVAAIATIDLLRTALPSNGFPKR